MSSTAERIEILLGVVGAREVQAQLAETSAQMKGLGASAAMAGEESNAGAAAATKHGKAVSMMGKAALFGGLALGAGLAVGLKKSVEEFSKSQVIGASVNRVLKQTHGQANITAKGIEELSRATGMKTGVDIESIRQSMGMMLTFRNVRNEVGKGNQIFSRSAKSAIDLSRGLTSMGNQTSASKAALQLGKALNDPAKGMTRLVRMGVSFNQSQIDMVKHLVATGHTLSAQKIILDEISHEFGKQSDAYGKTLPGAMGKLHNAAHMIEIAIGAKLAPVITRFANTLTRLLRGIQTNTGEGGKLRQMAVGLWGAFKPVVTVFGKFVKALVDGNPAARMLAVGITAMLVAMRLATIATTSFGIALDATGIGLVIGALAALAMGLVYAYHHFTAFRNVVRAVWSWIKAHWPLLLSIIIGPIGAGVLYIIRHFSQVKAAASSVVHWITSRFNTLVHFVASLPGRIGKAAVGMWDGIKDAFKSALNWVIRAWDNFHLGFSGLKIAGHTVVPGFHLHLPHINQLAEGGVLRSSGSVLVGERGPELLSLGQGARVDPLPSPALAGFGGVPLESHTQIILQLGDRVLLEALDKRIGKARARR